MTDKSKHDITLTVTELDELIKSVQADDLELPTHLREAILLDAQANQPNPQSKRAFTHFIDMFRPPRFIALTFAMILASTATGYALSDNFYSIPVAESLMNTIISDPVIDIGWSTNDNILLLLSEEE